MTILHHRRRPSRRRQHGMTLIEIMIVVGVLALMVGMLVLGFSSGRNAETSRKVNQIANLVRYGFDKARVTGRHYRLLVDMDEKVISLQEGDGRMYLPATDRDGRIVEYDKSKAEDQAQRDERAEKSFNQSVQAEAVRDPNEASGEATYEDAVDPYKPHPRKVPRRKPPLFQRFDDEGSLPDLAGKVAFGDDLKVTSVRTAEDLKPIEAGSASVYFFPRGRTQQTHIQLEDADGTNKYTIKIAPLTGRVTIVDGHEDLVLPEDAGDEVDELGNRTQRRSF